MGKTWWQQGGSRWQQNEDTNYHELYFEDKNRKNLFPRCIPNICVAGSSKARNWQLEGDELAVRRSRSGSSSACTEQTERKYAIYDSKVCYLGVLNGLLFLCHLSQNRADYPRYLVVSETIYRLDCLLS